MAFDGTNMWIANSGSNSVTKLSPTGAVLGTFTIGSGPAGIAFDGTNMWVANSGSNSVTELSPSGAVLGTFAVGTRPEGIASARTTHTIWVTNSGSTSVTELGQLIAVAHAGLTAPSEPLTTAGQVRHDVVSL